MSHISLSHVSSKYGAPMGRPSDGMSAVKATEPTKRILLQKIPLNQGGYDHGGAYWGTGKTLWRAWVLDAEGNEVECYVRAWTRDEAKSLFPGRKFYR